MTLKVPQYYYLPKTAFYPCTSTASCFQALFVVRWCYTLLIQKICVATDPHLGLKWENTPLKTRKRTKSILRELLYMGQEQRYTRCRLNQFSTEFQLAQVII